jgi:hypothetical protein
LGVQALSGEPYTHRRIWLDGCILRCQNASAITAKPAIIGRIKSGH